MRNPIRRVWSTLARIEEIRAVILWLFPPSGAIATMVSAYANSLPLYQILFWGSGVFAFLAAAVFYTWNWRQQLTAFEKLRLSSVGVTSITKSKDEKIGIVTQYVFHNHAEVPIYISLTRANISIDGRVNPNAKVNSQVSLIQPRTDYHVTAAVVPGLEKKEVMTGTAEFTVLYGKNKDNLRYMMEHEGDLDLHIVDVKEDPRAAHVTISMRHKRVEHLLRPRD